MHPDGESIGRSPASGPEAGIDWVGTRPRATAAARLLSCLDAVYAYALRMAEGEASGAAAAVEVAYTRASRESGSWREPETLIRLLAICHEIVAARGRSAEAGARVGGKSGPEPAAVPTVSDDAIDLLRAPGVGEGGILAEVDRLPPEERAPVVLADLQGLRYAEIATVLRLPEPVVRERLYRGRALLQARVLEVAQGEAQKRRRVV